jgi:hypothetical protein
MKDIVLSLEHLAKLTKTTAETGKVKDAIGVTKLALQKSKSGISNGELEALNQLETELETWQSKLAVILREPVGRQGMIKHIEHWATRLKGI